MRWRSIFVLVCSSVASGCGGGDSTAPRNPDERAQIVAVVDAANRSFAEGDYAATCRYYTPSAQKEAIDQIHASSCIDAWKRTEIVMKNVLSPEQYKATVSYGVDPASVRVQGDRATAHFGDLPEVLRGLDLPPRGEIRLRRKHGTWLIDSLPK